MNYGRREFFLDKVYTSFRFEQMKKENSMKALIKFHSNNKYLLMAYNQTIWVTYPDDLLNISDSADKLNL